MELKFYAENGNCTNADFFKNGAAVDEIVVGKPMAFHREDGGFMFTPAVTGFKIFGNGYLEILTNDGAKYQLTTDADLTLYPENGACAHKSFFDKGAVFDVIKTGHIICFVESKGRHMLTTTPVTSCKMYGNGYFEIDTTSGSRYQLTI